jgi:uncharacterized coiled-coil protein SlyX
MNIPWRRILRRTTAALDQTQQQVGDLTAKMNALETRMAAQPAVQVPSGPGATASNSAAPRRPREDSRFKKLQSQLDAQGQQIEQTRNDLTSTQGDLASARTDLTGSIAHTHDELVTLEKKGERNYIEFDLSKAKQFHREGPVEIRLRKANSKHGFADLELLVDDRNLSQKHVNLYQPVMYSTPGSPQPVEVVINDIGKDHIHGYVSAPKYQQSELDAMANAGTESGVSGTGQSTAQDAAQGAANSSDEPSRRVKLPQPQ